VCSSCRLSRIGGGDRGGGFSHSPLYENRTPRTMTFLGLRPPTVVSPKCDRASAWSVISAKSITFNSAHNYRVTCREYGKKWNPFFILENRKSRLPPCRLDRRMARSACFMNLHAVSIFDASSSPSAWIEASRILNFWILPVMLIGNSVTKMTYRGIL